jgi:hypothetical protein
MSTLTDLIEAFRQETEDLVHANVRKMFRAKYGEETIIAGDNSIVLPVGTDDTYETANEYDIAIAEAKDLDNIDIKDALVVKDITASGFVITSPRAGAIRWYTFLRTPDFFFWT